MTCEGHVTIILVEALFYGSGLIATLAISACGRIGYDASESDASGLPAASDAKPQPIDAMEPLSACELEVLLTAASQTVTGSFIGDSVSEVSVTFAPANTIAIVGLGAGHGDGYSGTKEFRSSTDSQFDAAMAPLMDGTQPGAAIGAHIFPGGGDGLIGTPLDNPVAGRRITNARQIISSLTLAGNDQGTDYSVTVTWELWGCGGDG